MCTTKELSHEWFSSSFTQSLPRRLLVEWVQAGEKFPPIRLAAGHGSLPLQRSGVAVTVTACFRRLICSAAAVTSVDWIAQGSDIDQYRGSLSAAATLW